MNFSSAIVLIIILILVTCIIKKMHNDHKSGKHSCGGNCGSCGNMHCNTSSNLVDTYHKCEKC
ncbi:MAG: FeoB-associated Cys-rich membrane protein [Thomasclavelia sp.]|nr:FeoB-associated Cys-rich membrane protein [Thomasclavelia sp.]